jgi:hypothetical protein
MATTIPLAIRGSSARAAERTSAPAGRESPKTTGVAASSARASPVVGSASARMPVGAGDGQPQPLRWSKPPPGAVGEDAREIDLQRRADRARHLVEEALHIVPGEEVILHPRDELALAGAALGLAQALFLDREHRLIGEGREQPLFFFLGDTGVAAEDGEGACHLATDDERDGHPVALEGVAEDLREEVFEGGVRSAAVARDEAFGDGVRGPHLEVPVVVVEQQRGARAVEEQRGLGHREREDLIERGGVAQRPAHLRELAEATEARRLRVEIEIELRLTQAGSPSR